MTAIEHIPQARTEFTSAVKHLDFAIGKLFPEAPKDGGKEAPKIDWGKDRGVFNRLQKAGDDLEVGLDLLTEVYTRRQAGDLFKAIDSDIANVFEIRNVAMTIADSDHLDKYANDPVLNDTAKGELVQAVADAKAAIALLNGRV